tara:strand:+ start:7425 stop:8165 length:741 start_codon:yes stop_codon:yes gene_type:complete
MKVSIITASYNSQKNILDAIESVKNQDYQNIEHVFIDGNSSDKTLEIIEKNALPNSFIVSERDGGIYDALNKGLNISSGDIVGFLHSDDTLMPHSLSSVVSRFNEYNGTDIVYGNIDYVSKNNPTNIVRKWRSGDFNLTKLRNGWMPPHTATFIKRDIYSKYGFFNTEFSISADYEILLRFLYERKVPATHLDEVLVKMRLGGESNRNLKLIAKKTAEDFRILRKKNINAFRAVPLKNMRKLFQFI